MSAKGIRNRIIAGLVLVLILQTAGAVWAQSLPKLQVSSNKRFLVKPDGTPFIWIGDTLWEWSRMTSQEQDLYLNKRAAQGYTVIQTHVGNDEVVNRDPAQWAAFDAWLQKIKARNMYAAVGIGWIFNNWDPNPQFTVQQMYDFGYWVGNRYRDQDHIIWLGANEATWPDAPLDKLNALKNGIRDGDTGNKLLTFHPLAGGATSYFFTDLDFNAWQTARYLAPKALPDYNQNSWNNGTYTVWEAMAHDYNAYPTKPVIDLEGWYEGGLNEMDNGTVVATAWHVRRRAYFVILAGSFGHTYGAWGLWGVESNWQTALNYPGGDDMRHIRTLLESSARPYLKLVPDQNLISYGQGGPDDYDAHKQAARASDGSYAYVYSANGSNFSVNLIALGSSGQTISGLWFNPRDGSLSNVNLNNPYARIASQSFDPPGAPGAGNDWVLILTPDQNKDPLPVPVPDPVPDPLPDPVPVPVNDTVKPELTAFSAAVNGSSVILSFTGTDSGGSHIGEFQVYRANVVPGVCDLNAKNGCQWSNLADLTLNIAAQNVDQYSGAITQTGVAVGTYLYGMHILDQAGNRAFEPQTQRVAVTTAVPGSCPCADTGPDSGPNPGPG